MKRDQRLTVVLTRAEREQIELLQKQLSERGRRASLSGVVVALVSQALQPANA